MKSCAQPQNTKYKKEKKILFKGMAKYLTALCVGRGRAQNVESEVAQ